MTKRIFRSVCLVVLTVFFASVILIMGALYEYFSNVEQEQPFLLGMIQPVCLVFVIALILSVVFAVQISKKTINVTEKEKAEQMAEQMRREFSANVSHELKTPLHSISGYAELLKNGLVKEDDRIPFAGKIYDEAQRMIRLVEDIISLSHLDEGAKDMQTEPVDIYELARKAVRSLEPAADSVGVTLEVSGDSAVLNGIAGLLYSLIYNLCDNAIKYNHENGKVMVNVRNENNTLVLSVRDTGIGIAAEHQERIFERFYRVDKSHSKAVGGTGLGLSIVKHTAMIHNAKIELNSTIGKGTTVVVRIPRQGKRRESVMNMQ